MSAEILTERLFEALIEGNRDQARRIIDDQRKAGADPQVVITDLCWPTYEMIETMHRQDRLTTLAYNLATRMLRTIVDQASRELLAWSGSARTGRTVFACCGPSEGSELGAQMAVDLLEAAGFRVRFAGGAIPTDEIQEAVQTTRPDVLLMFCSEPRDLPEIRHLIDTLHEVGACPHTQIAVGGGVFNRAEGLAEEIGADLWASHPLEMIESLIEDAEIRATPEQRTVGQIRPRTRRAA
ncbi:MAG: cobalamin-dependent protein [Phycisphaerales bacterium]|nr:cobalamin-dependent protein [Planctomycetota bacterium]MCH8508601.1 cobalamin-dependent protein [Phycisphaerales bacterium]